MRVTCDKCGGIGILTYYEKTGVWSERCEKCAGLGTLDVVDTAVSEAALLFACQHCRVHSIKLSTKEYAEVRAGQQMIEACPVCGKEVIIND